MKQMLDYEEILHGSSHDLRLSSEGLTLYPRGKQALPPQAARYEEIARPTLTGGTLQVGFVDQRPEWVISGLPAVSANWAYSLLDTNVRRASQRQGPAFTQAAPLKLLNEVFAEFATSVQPDPYLLAQAILAQAVWHRASDVHLAYEPQASGEIALVVYYRVHGQLQPVAALPAEVGQRAMGAIKVAADMPSYATARPQTGRLTVPAPGRTVEVRLTSLPTAAGEKLTARLFDPTARPHDLALLGLEPEVLAAYRDLLAQPQGCILLTGAAGSGKSTTMYSSLEAIKREMPWRHLATAEEPVEYSLAQVQQTEINREGGLDFAHVLRVMLRQDPQVIMIGEIRDRETAEIAIQAGLTGHLIFSTVHAPGTVGVFARLADLGVEPYLLTSSVSAVLTQRLVRTLCPACATPSQPTAEELATAGLTPQEAGAYTFRQAQGCEQCLDGYSGRSGVFALLPVTGELRQAVMDQRPIYEIEGLAPQLPPGGLWEAGLRKVARGEVALGELIRVLGKRGQ